jgi:4-aminobutyrate aminotransferase-like enzyme
MSQGATLWAADGTAYLDCVNNVAHVGHCHVKVSHDQTQIRVLSLIQLLQSERSGRSALM